MQYTHSLYLWTAVGAVGLALWAGWWGLSWKRNTLVHVNQTWIMGWRFLGLDFLNNYQASRHWLAGGDAYRDTIDDPLSRAFCYPPLVLPTFAWCAWFSSQRAMHIFMLTLTSITGVGVWAASRARRELNLEPMPYVLLLAAVLLSTPLMYALERGNYDLLVLPPLLIAAWCLRERTWLRDGLAGLCLAYATGIKIYPGLVVLSLLPLRRPRALVFCGLAGLALLLFHPGDYGAFRANAAALVAENDPRISRFLSWSMHSLTATWPLLVEPLGFNSLVRMPGTLAALFILGPIIGLVSWQIYRCAEPRRLILPYFLWMTAAATFLPPIANDYSLVFLPLAVVALWDRRDPLLVHLAMGLLLLWWQPWQLDIGPRVLMAGKVTGLWAMGISLMNRTCKQNQQNYLTDVSQTIVLLPRAA